MRKSAERPREKTEDLRESEFQKLKREWESKKKLISSSIDIFNLTNSKAETRQENIQILEGRKPDTKRERVSGQRGAKPPLKQESKSRSRTRFADSKRIIGLEKSQKRAKVVKKEKKSKGQFERQRTNMSISQNADVKSVSDSSFEWLLNNRNANLEKRSRNSSKKKSYQERLKESFLQKKNNDSKSIRKSRQRSARRFDDQSDLGFEKNVTYKIDKTAKDKKEPSIQMEKDLMIQNKLI